MKLGGSILTDKSRYRTAKDDDIRRLGQEIAASGERVVLVHGAGSFGHVLAKHHDLASGDAGAGGQAAADRRLAAARVHADVRELTARILAALRDAGLPAFHVSTYDVARLTSGKLTSFATEPIHETLARGLTPVLSGDVALDHARGWGILSGDVLMVELAKALRPARAIFATDVDGIYDRDPREAGAKLLAEIDATTSVDAARAGVPDITGSMAGKLARARDVARAGVPVHVVNGSVAGRFGDALAGKPVVGTSVRG